jgi:hypothetical protein
LDLTFLQVIGDIELRGVKHRMENPPLLGKFGRGSRFVGAVGLVIGGSGLVVRALWEMAGCFGRREADRMWWDYSALSMLFVLLGVLVAAAGIRIIGRMICGGWEDVYARSGFDDGPPEPPQFDPVPAPILPRGPRPLEAHAKSSEG